MINKNISNEDSIKMHQEWESQFFKPVNPPKLSFWQMVISYIKFEISSITNGTVSSKIFEKRKKQCMTCDGRILDKTDPIGYCNKCGCSKNPRSRLSVKLTVSGAECPLGKWKKEKGRINLKNIPRVAISISRTLWYNAKQLWQRN
jgi:hypothetical protein